MTIQEMKDRKKELGYSYEQISSLSGVPVGTVRKVFGGITKSPRSSTLQSLARALEKREDKMAVGVAEPAAAYAVRKRQGEFTLEDYLMIPDERRVELIDGVIYDMAAPTGYHQLIAGQVYAKLLAYITARKGKCLPFISPVDVQLDCDNRTIVQPDVLILCDPGKYTPARIVGAPDFVLEVLSKSTSNKDRILKLYKYYNAGVREYWIVDPKEKQVLTYFFGKKDLEKKDLEKKDPGGEVQFHLYSFRDQIPVGIYGGDLVIDFAGIDDYVSPWMG